MVEEDNSAKSKVVRINAIDDPDTLNLVKRKQPFDKIFWQVIERCQMQNALATETPKLFKTHFEFNYGKT